MQTQTTCRCLVPCCRGKHSTPDCFGGGDEHAPCVRLRITPWSSRQACSICRSFGAAPLHTQTTCGCLVHCCRGKHSTPECVGGRDEHAPWSSRKLARSTRASWWQRSAPNCTSAGDEHAPGVRLRIAPWSSRKLARSVGASGRLGCKCKPLAAGALVSR